MYVAFDPRSAREIDVGKDRTWFVDAQGRYVLFRGVNFASRSKLAPYLPILPLSVRSLDQNAFAIELKRVTPQLDLLQDLGFNLVRLIVMWKGVEPTFEASEGKPLPSEGEVYLQCIKKVIDDLYRRGIFVVIDMHQDIAHEWYDGAGFPDWAIAIDHEHERPLDYDHRDKLWATRYFDTEFPIVKRNNDLVRNTLASFWRNSLTNLHHHLENYPIRTHYARTVGKIAKFFLDSTDGMGHPAILGYEPFNEPHPVGMNKRLFEERVLPSFYEEVLRQIRRYDSRAFMFVQPRVDWTVYPAWAEKEYMGANFVSGPEDIETFLDTSSIGYNERTIFSFHYYDPWTMLMQYDSMRMKRDEWPSIFRKLANSARSREMVPFLTEFGASQDWMRFSTDFRPDVYDTQTRAYMDLQYRQIEANLFNSAYWVYDLYNEGDDNWNMENFSLLGLGRIPRNLDVVARPYPLRSSGKPRLLFFDIKSKHCSIIIEGPLSTPEAKTVVYVPKLFHYRNGFQVNVTSPLLEWDEKRQLLYWELDSKIRLNHLTLCPRNSFDPDVLPREARQLMSETSYSFYFQGV